MDPTIIRQHADAETWDALCAYLRQWYASACPLYRRDEVEIAVGTKVGGLAIRKQQLATYLAEGRTENGTTPSVYFKGAPLTAERASEILDREIAAYVRDEPATYRRMCERVETWPVAEVKVAQVLGRIRPAVAG